MAQSVGTGQSMREAAQPYLNKWGPYRLTRDEVNTTAIRYFCEVVEDANPVYWDAEFAKQTRFGRVIAPPQAVFSMTFQPWWTPDYVAEKLERDSAAMSEGAAESNGAELFQMASAYGYVTVTVTDTENEYIAPFGPGDGRLKTRSKTVDVSEEKQTRPGKGVFISSVTEYRTEVGDRLVARSSMVVLHYDPATPRQG